LCFIHFMSVSRIATLSASLSGSGSFLVIGFASSLLFGYVF
jgi:hypothetical protein